MKKILYIVIAATLVLSSCSDFLVEDNKSDIPSGEFYKKASGFNSLLNSTYAYLREIYGDNQDMLIAGTDLYLVGRARGHTESPLGMYRNLEPTNDRVKTFYSNCYQAIGRANAVLYYGDVTEQTDNLPRQLAEARFLRAYFYFHLVQQFGGVPIVEEMTDRILLDFPRNTEMEVYDFIIREMEALKPQLMVRATGNDYGRVDQRTCNFFLAKAYLTRGWISNSQADFQKAKEYGIAAIGGQKLTLSFEQAYAPMNYAYRNDEVIWSVIYSPQSMETTTDGNNQAAHFGGYLDGSPAGNKPTDGSYALNIYAHWLFTKDIENPLNELRYDLTIMKYVYQHSLEYYFESEAELAQRPITAYYPTWWNPDYNNIDGWIAENPAQRTGTIIRKLDNPGNPDVNLTAFQEASTTYTWNSNSNYWYPTFRKFDCPEILQYAHSQKASFRDVDIARINDAYLTVAEACLQLDDKVTAAEYINEVRGRSIAEADPKRFVTADQVTIDFILDERARELMGHYDRWYDLKRTNKLIERAVKYNPDLEWDASRFEGRNGEKKILRPIPQDAIDANRAGITQNPAYN